MNLGQGYLEFEEKFEVGIQKKITLEIKPRTKNGIILYAKSSNKDLKDFVLIELVDGALRATVNNGGPKNLNATVNLPIDESCNGEWHQIQLIKVANLIVLDFDDITSGPVINKQKEDADFITDADLLYIGGYPNELKKSYLEDTVSYAGCIRSLKIASKDNTAIERNLDFKKVIKHGNIDLDSCPTT